MNSITDHLIFLIYLFYLKNWLSRCWVFWQADFKNFLQRYTFQRKKK